MYRAGPLDPIAYTYEADYHCPGCAYERFGADEDGWIAAHDERDGEGNPVGVVAPWDEWWEPSEDGPQVLTCGTCGGEIDRLEGDEPDEGEDVWTLLDEAPAHGEAVADLYHWSTNYDAGKGPFALFFDLLGWSEDELGEPIYKLREASLGFVELDKLGLALREYADNPHEVREYVDALMRAELSS
jgi:hypothetical protein